MIDNFIATVIIVAAGLNSFTITGTPIPTTCLNMSMVVYCPESNAILLFSIILLQLIILAIKWIMYHV